MSEPALTTGGTHEAWTPDGPVPPAPPKVDENAVIEAIKTVYDPEIPIDVYELGLVYAVDIGDDGAVRVEMTLTTPSCPSAQELPTMVEEAVRTVPNVTDAKVEVVWDPPWDATRMSDDAKLALNVY